MINEKLLQEIIQKHLPRAFVNYGQQGFMCQVHYPELCKIIDEYIQAGQVEPEVKPEIAEEKLRTLFRNNSDCYADTWTFNDKGQHIDGEVIQALTENKFIEIVKKQFSV